MREIKFRAWDRATNSMVTESWKLFLNGCVSIQDTWATSDVHLMQFTGLKDKNGKEIFEGDILAHMSTRRAGYEKDGDTIYKKIVFGRSNPQCNSVTDYMGFWAVSLGDDDLSCGGSIGYQTKSLGAVVIGNIHENPELLQK